ncbi:Hypothetical_protein [Hexamita inflata]|uniref:Hypothetical_protein n=1 Tax=Hexamita inflata TaxID=28002 RepID=A0ABP1HGT8_9EUKA
MLFFDTELLQAGELSSQIYIRTEFQNKLMEIVSKIYTSTYGCSSEYTQFKLFSSSFQGVIAFDLLLELVNHRSILLIAVPDFHDGQIYQSAFISICRTLEQRKIQEQSVPLKFISC